MRVFAEYFEQDQLSYRRNTILQFGDSWQLIGNAVLANPGRAEPKQKPDIEHLNSISKFYSEYRRDEEFIQDNWQEFGGDPTMGFVQKIFNGGYIDKTYKLNGVIQLFNTFNIKETKPEKAIEKLEKAIEQVGVESDLLFSPNVERHFHDKPTYFGFGHDIFGHKLLRGVAEKIFKNSSDEVKKIYHSEFSKNKFYHPRWFSYGHKSKVLELLLRQLYD